MDSHDEMAHAQKTAKIRELNDRLRTTGSGGKMMMTRAVAALPPETLAAVLLAIRQFDNFTSAVDPWGEHDFGSITISQTTIFWKIDAYDCALEFGSPDPTDEAQTRRVLTLMVAKDL